MGEARVLGGAPAREGLHGDAVRAVVPPARLVGGEAQVPLLVVAEHALRPELAGPAEHADRVGAAVEQIAEEDEAIATWRVVRRAEQRVELRETAVHVPDHEGASRAGHSPRI
jgi:hypothetical protein